jgi:glutathione synthase/RimK-type ligase-like ATP-grasp enzyme
MTEYGDVPVTVALVAEERHLGNRALVDAQAAWLAHGCRIEVVVPDAARLYDVPVQTPPWSVVVSRGRHLAGLGLLAAASALGVPAVNDPRAIELVRNKIGMQAVLSHHGIPLPRTWFAGDPAVFGQLPADLFPLVVKPYDGDGARGLALLTEPADVALLPPIKGRRSLYLAQEYLQTDGFDLKLYGIGSKVWAVRKPSPVSFEGGPGPAEFTSAGEAELVDIDPQLRDIALTCGRACQLELWGVDVAMTPDGPAVIEVNDFPTYSAVPGAGAAIAEHVLTLVEMHAVAQGAGREHYRSIVRRPQ